MMSVFFSKTAIEEFRNTNFSNNQTKIVQLFLKTAFWKNAVNNHPLLGNTKKMLMNFRKQFFSPTENDMKQCGVFM